MEKDLKGGGDMEILTEQRTVYGEKCPYCKALIKGASESAMKYNLGIHVDKHLRLGELPSKKK